MSEPDDWDVRLMAYVDGELDDAAAAEVEARIARDDAARESVAMYRETSMLLRAACGEQRFRSPSPRRSLPARRPRRRMAALAMAASVALVLAGFGAGLWWQNDDSDDRLAEVAEYHAVWSRETSHLAEIPAARASEFTKWMSHRLGRDVTVPDLSEAGLTFAGGRMLVIDGKPAADILYTRAGGRPVALCILQGGRSSPLATAMRHSLRLAHWEKAGATYVIVGELSEGDALAVARLAEPQV